MNRWKIRGIDRYREKGIEESEREGLREEIRLIEKVIESNI